MDLHRLEYFLAVADERHFRRAAERLQMTPSPLSRQIRLLERDVGGELFVREYHEVHLTPLGQALVEPARDILARTEALKALADRVTRRRSPLRLAVGSRVPSPLVDGLLGAVGALDRAAADGVDIGAGDEEIAERLLGGQLDLGLVHLPVPDERLEFEYWDRYPIGLALRADDLLAGKEDVGLEDLRSRAVILDAVVPNAAVGRWLTDRLSDAGLRELVRLPGNPVGEGAIAAHVRHRRRVALVADLPDSVGARVFSPPDFAVRRLERGTLGLDLALAWSPTSPETGPRVRSTVRRLTADTRWEPASA